MQRSDANRQTGGQEKGPQRGEGWDLEDEGAGSHVGVGRRDSHTESQPGMCELQEDSSGAEHDEG